MEARRAGWTRPAEKQISSTPPEAGCARDDNQKIRSRVKDALSAEVDVLDVVDLTAEETSCETLELAG